MIGIMIGQCDQLFRKQLGGNDRALRHECRDIRNHWAHQHAFTFDHTYRALDSIERLLLSVGAPDQANEIDRQNQEVVCNRARPLRVLGDALRRLIGGATHLVLTYRLASQYLTDHVYWL